MHLAHVARETQRRMRGHLLEVTRSSVQPSCGSFLPAGSTNGPSAARFLFRGCSRCAHARATTYAMTHAPHRDACACDSTQRAPERFPVNVSAPSRILYPGSCDLPADSKPETPSPGLYLHSDDGSAVTRHSLLVRGFELSSNVLLEDARVATAHALKFHPNPVSRVIFHRERPRCARVLEVKVRDLAAWQDMSQCL